MYVYLKSKIKNITLGQDDLRNLILRLTYDLHCIHLHIETICYIKLTLVLLKKVMLNKICHNNDTKVLLKYSIY